MLVVPLAICSEQQDVILRRQAITGGAAPTTIRTKPPVVVLLHVSRSVHSWSWLWMAAGKFGGFPWDPGETSITCRSELLGDYEGLEPWPPPDHHSSRASCLRSREMSWAGGTVHAVNSNRVQILGKIRLDRFVISINLEIGFLRVKSMFLKSQVSPSLYKDGIVFLLRERKSKNYQERSSSNSGP